MDHAWTSGHRWLQRRESGVFERNKQKAQKTNHSPVELGVEETVAASISIALDDEALSKSSAAVVGYAAESSGAVKDRAIRDRN